MFVLHLSRWGGPAHVNQKLLIKQASLSHANGNQPLKKKKKQVYAWLTASSWDKKKNACLQKQVIKFIA